MAWLISLINVVVYWIVCLHPDKPNFVGLDEFLLYPWLCVSLLVLPYSLWESCLAPGWQCCSEIDEQTGLWLGGTLQGRSWLWTKFFQDKYYCLC